MFEQFKILINAIINYDLWFELANSKIRARFIEQF